MVFISGPVDRERRDKYQNSTNKGNWSFQTNWKQGIGPILAPILTAAPSLAPHRTQNGTYFAQPSPADQEGGSKAIMLKRSIIICGLNAICWEFVFLVSYFSSVLGRINQGVAAVMMDGAAICGILSAVTCYFPMFLKHRFNWNNERQGVPVAASFLLLFTGLGICWLVVTMNWIGTM